MGWQDDPVVGGASGGGSAAPWANDQIVGPANAPSASATSAPTQTWSDYLLGHLAGAGQTADDFVRSFDRALTLGYFDKALGYATGQNETALTQQAAQRSPWASTAGDVTGYLAGPAKLGIAGRLGGGVLGSAGELGAVGALTGAGEANKPSDIAPDALIGGVAGGIGGLGVGAAGKYVVNPLVNAVGSKVGQWTGALATPEVITNEAKAASLAAFNDLKTVPVPDAADAAANARAAIEADPDGLLKQNAPRTMTELKKLDQRIQSSGQALTGQDAMNWLQQQRPDMTNDEYAAAFNQLQQSGQVQLPSGQSAHSVVTTLQNLDNIMGPNAGAENDAGRIVQAHLQTALDNAGATPLQDAANAAHKTYKDASFLQNAGQNLQLLKQSPASEAARIAQTYYPSGAADLMANRPTPEAAKFKSLADIVNAGGGLPSAYSMMHAVYPLTEAAGAGLGAMMGGPGGAFAGEMAGGLAGGAAKTAMSSALSGLQRRATQAAINRAYPVLTPGRVTFPPVDMNPALRGALYGWGRPYLQ